jgi:hypothetical protein
VGRPLGGSSPEPVSHPLGGHEKTAVSVKAKWADPRSAREAGSLWARVIERALRQREQIDGPTATRAGRGSAPIAAVHRSFRQSGGAFEHPCALGG